MITFLLRPAFDRNLVAVSLVKTISSRLINISGSYFNSHLRVVLDFLRKSHDCISIHDQIKHLLVT